MKKLLYITVNSKPEELSSSKTVGRAFVNRFVERNKEFKVEELDLYKEHIPRLEYAYFEKRNCVVNKDDFNKLDENEKKEVHKIVKLCDQFKEADMYVIAAPMWSLSFPAPLKEYIDCIVQDGKTIRITRESMEGLLDDKTRGMVYIQSSGASIPWLLKMVLNKGVNYVESIMRAMGIKKFHELLVDGTGSTEEERIEAIDRALKNIDNVIDDVWK
ncbi:FMN-dependent NADH-azoreductase [Clostridium botulinum]|uniref:FMN dependent NADH:quinone oxidoreductase n=1 Tax=Clostridium botulinum TaxID=1491 RepID=A0A9Q1UXH4_CLOBO|nr:NAD(P)H-dependent oxidoreductase [Clostridium botulinum]KEI02644.1 FMN-dependent NADH-azoreductase [Clostridium botulinum C/D str. Sp77]KLU75772.1 FMN-dependent NADH-azoreductase [Clostridium botulinum V891]KOA72680.1 FMN-dependent NADH-azoreductase [Clostridium botulinum]KOA77297.1 FMN-dependent NADH-azoreductase [Clostridium botulinum]KOA84950.1 FMN-dependent NADH-azoreductase [Clostridium botulinum]